MNFRERRWNRAQLCDCPLYPSFCGRFQNRKFEYSDNNCVVTATSNSHFFDGLEYEYQCNAKLSKSDISIKWLTIMGTEEASKENQYIIADVILSADDKVVSERKINFAKKAIENIGDVLNSKENTK